MNEYTPESTEEFRRVQYVKVSDTLNQLYSLTKVYPVYQWHIDSRDRLSAVTVSPNDGLSFVYLKVSQCSIFLSGDREILKILRGGAKLATEADKEIMKAAIKLQQKNERQYTDVTFSEMYSFKNCRQRWQYAYKDRITTKIDKPPLFLGSLYHKALEFYYNGVLAGEPVLKDDMIKYFLDEANRKTDKLREEWPNLEMYIEELEFQQNLGVAIIGGYYNFAQTNDHFKLEPVNGVSPLETKFCVPVITPNGNPSSKFRFTGKIDGIVKHLGHYWVHEIKTSSNWNDSDVDMLGVDPQCLGYIYAAQKHFGIKIAGAIYSVARKSLLRQGKAETVEHFRERLIKDYAARPDFYYRRHSIYTQQENVEEFGLSIWNICKDMSPNPFIYKSVGKATCGFGCSFKTLCTATSPDHRADAMDRFYRVKKARHEELQNDSN